MKVLSWPLAFGASEEQLGLRWSDLRSGVPANGPEGSADGGRGKSNHCRSEARRVTWKVGMVGMVVWVGVVYADGSIVDWELSRQIDV